MIGLFCFAVAKLGFEVAQSSVAKYMVKRRGLPRRMAHIFA
jgi:hypothetical protein